MSAIGGISLKSAEDWFAGRSPRERLILGLAAIVLAVGLFLSLIWRPLLSVRAAALERLDRQDRLIEVMRGNGAQLRSLAVTAPLVSTVPAATAITQEAATQQITVQRLEHDGAQYKVVLDNCAFSALITWLQRLETAHGLRIVGIELDRRPDPGVVSAQVTLGE